MLSEADYIVLLDFELSGQGTESSEDVRIVEASWIIIDSQTFEEVDVIQYFINSDVELSDAFYLRTGLTPEAFTNTMTFPQAVCEMDKKIYHHITSKQKSFILCVYGGRKLRDYFRAESRRHKINVSTHYEKFIDLSLELERYVQCAGPIDRTAAALNVKIDLSCRSSGYDLCVTMKHFLQAMKEKHYPLLNTQWISEAFDPIAYKNYFDPLPTHPSYNALLRIRGIPFEAKIQEVQHFFTDLPLSQLPNVANVLYIKGRDGRFSGEAFVRMADHTTLERALVECQKKKIGTRWIEVIRTDEGSLESYLRTIERAHYVNMSMKKFNRYVKIRGLPFSVTTGYVLGLFADSPIAVYRSQVTMGVQFNGMSSAMAYVALENAEQVEQVIAWVLQKGLAEKNAGEKTYSDKGLDAVECTSTEFHEAGDLRGGGGRREMGGGGMYEGRGGRRREGPYEGFYRGGMGGPGYGRRMFSPREERRGDERREREYGMEGMGYGMGGVRGHREDPRAAMHYYGYDERDERRERDFYYRRPDAYGREPSRDRLRY